jgi:hypothetical protein
MFTSARYVEMGWSVPQIYEVVERASDGWVKVRNEKGFLTDLWLGGFQVSEVSARTLEALSEKVAKAEQKVSDLRELRDKVEWALQMEE